MAQEELVWEYQVKTKEKTTEKKQRLFIYKKKKTIYIYIKLDANMIQKERGKTIHVKLIKHV